MEVHSNTESVANIPAIKDADSIPGVHISMDSRKEHAIIVECHNRIIKFQECNDGLYYYYTANKYTSHINKYSFLSTVNNKM